MLHELLQLTRPLILFDLETTGKDPLTARICSMGMRIHRPAGTVESWHSLIDPETPMPKDASDAHGITDDVFVNRCCAKCRAPEGVHPHGGCDRFWPIPRFADIAAKVYSGFQDADFGGYHIHYDLKVTCAEFARCGLEFDYSKAAIIDGLRVWQILEPRTLSDAYEYFLNRKLSGAHDAMVDISATEEVLIEQLKNHPLSSKLPRTVRELHDLCWPREPGQIDSEGKFKFIKGVPCFAFGKWKDHPMQNHRDYLQWMLSGGFSPEVKRICDAALAGTYPVEETSV